MGGNLGLKEAVAMALGGMIGGGIYSAFGIVVAISGKVAWLAFLVAGSIAMCAGYSYVKLNELADDRGGAPTYLREFVGHSMLAGMTGWTLLFGYIGSLALYAYAFASFFSELFGRLHFTSVLGVGSLPVTNTVAVLLIGRSSASTCSERPRSFRCCCTASTRTARPPSGSSSSSRCSSSARSSCTSSANRSRRCFPGWRG